LPDAESELPTRLVIKPQGSEIAATANISGASLTATLAVASLTAARG